MDSHIKKYYCQYIVILFLILQFILTREYYWVVGHRTFGIYFLYLILPWSIYFILFKAGKKKIGVTIFLISMMFKTVVEVKQVVQLNDIKQDIFGLAEEISKVVKNTGAPPKNFQDISYIFKYPFTRDAIKEYAVKGDGSFYITFKGPDPATSYSYSLETGMVYDDD